MLKKLIITTLIIFGLSYFLSGINTKNLLTALITAIVLGILNIFLKPLLLLLSIPINLLTFGLFTLVINTSIIMLVSYLVAGFTIANFWWALLLSMIISTINFVFLGRNK
jgi:putative membrane protein